MKQLIIFLILINTFFSSILNAGALPEYTLKTAYIYNFALLTNWTKEDTDGEFNLCFYREDFGAASDALQNKSLHNKHVKVRNVSTFEEAKECQVVFIRENESATSQNLIQHLKGLPILIIGESPRINNSHIKIVQENHRLAFDVSLKSLKNTDLTLSSRLLKLARKVEP
jgi:hypothetical protein